MSLLCESTICRPENHGGPREAQQVICDQCAKNFIRDLQAIADAYADVVTAIGGTTTYTVSEYTAAGGTMETGIVINERASKARTDLEAFTRWLVGTVLEAKPTIPAPIDTIPGLLRWVAKWHWGVFTDTLEQAGIVEAVTSARAAARTARNVAYPTGDRRVPIPATCRHDIDGEPCGAELVAIIVRDGRRPSEIQCVNDRTHSIPAMDWVKYGRKILAAA